MRTKEYLCILSFIGKFNYGKHKSGNMKNLNIEIGEYLRNLRKQRNETLHQLAIETDIDSPMLSKLERGVRLPTDSQLERLAMHYKISIFSLKAMNTAQKIIKDYGENKNTYAAIQMVNEKLAKYKTN